MSYFLESLYNLIIDGVCVHFLVFKPIELYLGNYTVYNT